jgi:hypothetical protein
MPSWLYSWRDSWQRSWWSIQLRCWLYRCLRLPNCGWLLSGLSSLDPRPIRNGWLRRKLRCSGLQSGLQSGLRSGLRIGLRSITRRRGRAGRVRSRDCRNRRHSRLGKASEQTYTLLHALLPAVNRCHRMHELANDRADKLCDLLRNGVLLVVLFILKLGL